MAIEHAQPRGIDQAQAATRQAHLAELPDRDRVEPHAAVDHEHAVAVIDIVFLNVVSEARDLELPDRNIAVPNDDCAGGLLRAAVEHGPGFTDQRNALAVDYDVAADLHFL